ncbi:MAG: TIGR04086 family membrane protein [Firmicutes bacterium]|nr:TIGR04086 family membrane protein [Bacillota bacterium]
MRTSRETAGAAFSAAALATGLAVSLVAAAVLAVALTLVGHFSRLSDPWLARGGFYAGLLAPLAGGLAAGRAADRLGWLHGGLAGAVYVLLAVLVDTLAGGGVARLPLLRELVLGMGLGAAGGMLGVAL